MIYLTAILTATYLNCAVGNLEVYTKTFSSPPQNIVEGPDINTLYSQAEWIWEILECEKMKINIEIIEEVKNAE